MGKPLDANSYYNLYSYYQPNSQVGTGGVRYGSQHLVPGAANALNALQTGYANIHGGATTPYNTFRPNNYIDPYLAGEGPFDAAYGRPDLPGEDVFTGELDEASPYYKFQQELGERAINRAMQARGKFDSTTGINALSDFNRGLAAEEAERQYGRRADAYQRALGRYGLTQQHEQMQYGRRLDARQRALQNYMLRRQAMQDQYSRVMDLANLQQQEYNRILNQIGIGQAAAALQGQGATQAGQQMGSVYGQMGNALAAGELGQGQAWGGFWSGAGAMPYNMMAMNYYNQAQQKPPAQNPYYASPY